MVEASSHADRTLILFFISTFFLSWLLWTPRLLVSVGIRVDFRGARILSALAPFGPFLAALGLSIPRRGAVRGLLRRGWSLNFPKLWLIPAVLLPPVQALITMGILVLTGHSVSWEPRSPTG